MHAQPIAAGYVALTTGYGALYIALAADAGRRCSSRGGTSSDAPAAGGLPVAGGRRRCSGAPRSSLQVARDRAFGTDVPAEQVLYVQSPEVARPAGALVRRAGRRRLLDPRPAALRRRAARRPPQERNYELLYPLLDLTTRSTRTSTSPTASARSSWPSRSRAGPAGPIWRSSCSRRACRRQPTKWQYMQDIGFVHYWALQDYKGAADWFERGSRAARRGLVPEAAGRRRRWPRAASAAPRGRCSRRIAESRRERLDAQGRARAGCGSSTPWTRSTRCAQSSARYRQRGGAPPVTWQALVRAGYLRAIPTDPDGVVFALEPWSGDVSLGDGLDAARRCPTHRPSPPAVRARDRLARALAFAVVARSACSAWRSAASSTSASTGSRSASRSSTRRRAACAAARRCAGTTTCRSSAGCVLRRPVRVLRRAGLGALSARRAADRRGLRAARVRVRAGPAAAGAAGRSRRC